MIMKKEHYDAMMKEQNKMIKRLKTKSRTHHAQTVNEAIDDIQMFFDSDMYSKFRPEHKIGKEKWYRQDVFRNEKEFREYLEDHFKILKQEIRRLK